MYTYSIAILNETFSKKMFQSERSIDPCKHPPLIIFAIKPTW